MKSCINYSSWKQFITFSGTHIPAYFMGMALFPRKGNTLFLFVL